MAFGQMPTGWGSRGPVNDYDKWQINDRMLVLALEKPAIVCQSRTLREKNLRLLTTTQRPEALRQYGGRLTGEREREREPLQWNEGSRVERTSRDQEKTSLSRFAHKDDSADCSADVDGDDGDASGNERQAAIGIATQLRALGAESRAIGDDLGER